MSPVTPVLRKRLLGLGVAVLALMVMAAFVVYASLFSPNALCAPTTVIIPQGSSVVAAGNVLERAGAVKSALGFRLAVAWLGATLKAGEYDIWPNEDPFSIARRIGAGQVKRYKVTFPEGVGIRQIARILHEAGLADPDAFIALATDPPPDIAQGLSISPPPGSLEGYLFPDTYEFSKDLSATQIIRAMLRRFADKAGPVIARGQGRLTAHEIVILASIVEKEAALSSERPDIARVFLNRLDRNMLLQSCATVQYALPEPKARLLLTDLRVNSPYNTYIHRGLPPGPIANPGLGSIKAVVAPSDLDALYFVATGNGSHVFSRTYADHVRAKARMERQSPR